MAKDSDLPIILLCGRCAAQTIDCATAGSVTSCGGGGASSCIRRRKPAWLEPGIDTGANPEVLATPMRKNTAIRTDGMLDEMRLTRHSEQISVRRQGLQAFSPRTSTISRTQAADTMRGSRNPWNVPLCFLRPFSPPSCPLPSYDCYKGCKFTK